LEGLHEMTPKEFLSKLDVETKGHLSAIHEIILRHDKKVKAGVQKMMGKEMICYSEEGVFKYALANMKNYMTLHAMPMYAAGVLQKKYSAKLPKAKFQKGCVNFKSAAEMPLDIVDELIGDCATVDYSAIIARFKTKK
jgi:hypothetical protein